MNAISADVIPVYWVSYFREYTRGMVHDELLETFDCLRDRNRASIAKKLNKRPEQITRWLSAPSNLEMDTIADLALAMGCVPKVTFEPVKSLARNHNGEQESQGIRNLDRPATGSSSNALEIKLNRVVADADA